MNALKKFQRENNVVVLIALLVLTGVSLIPFAWVISGAFKDNTEIFGSTSFLPEHWKWSNFEKVWTSGRFAVYFRNNLIVALTVTIMSVAVAAPAGYAFAKTGLKRFPALFYLYLFGITLPLEAIVVPLFYQIKTAGLVDSLWGLILAMVGVGVPFGVYLMRNFFLDIPDEMAEASRLDGANEWQTFVQIMMPMAKPGMLALGVFSFLSAWNEYFLSILILINDDRRTIPLGLVRYRQENMSDYGALFAAITLAIIPSILIYIVLQRSFISGLAAGATKG